MKRAFNVASVGILITGAALMGGGIALGGVEVLANAFNKSIFPSDVDAGGIISGWGRC